jgi:hypothetical protein
MATVTHSPDAGPSPRQYARLWWRVRRLRINWGAMFGALILLASAAIMVSATSYAAFLLVSLV